MIKQTTLLTGAIALALTFAHGPLAAEEADLPDARTLIDRHLEASGGRDALMAQTEGTMEGEFAMPAAGMTGSLMVASRDGNERVIRIELPGVGEIKTGFSPDLAWSIDPFMGPRLIEGAEFDALAESSLPEAILRDPGMVTATTVEQAEFLDQACWRVKLEWQSGRTTHDCYAIDSGFLIATESVEVSPMGELQTTTLMDDYQEFEGFKIATTTRVLVMGQEQVLTMNSFSMEAPDPALFELPPAIQTLLEDQYSRKKAPR